MTAATASFAETTRMTEHDVELACRVTNFLRQWQVPALRRILVEVSNGTVVLKGRVQSFYERQLCLNCSRRVAGVVRLVDLIEVAA